ncbi:MAG TPA: sulfite exporter TauE/SafE family protein [Hyphomicrobiaceae bacterium]|nr:sulfite exporter TauE/SafE family protein [Hyphomicrobiaceae bacterium]
MAVSQFSFLGGMMLGFASTLHCAGMCGGVASSLTLMFGPKTVGDRARILSLAQAGRVTSYMLAGAVLGYAGSELYGVFDRAGAFRVLQWFGAVVLIWLGLTFAGLLPMPAPVDRAVARISARLAKALAPLRSSAGGPYLAGLTWGIIPCPMVYAALFTAMLTGTLRGAVIFMAGFGLATMIPVFLTAFGVTTLASMEARGRARVVIGVVIALFGASTIIPASPTNGLLCALEPPSGHSIKR